MILLRHAEKSLETKLEVLGGARTREAKGRKAWNLPLPLPERFLRAAGKSLAQGQVALIEPTRL